MRRAGTIGLALAASLLLAACFLLPGKFASTLDVRRDGAFDFTYKGEIVLVALPGTGGRFVPEVDDPSRPCFGAGFPPPIVAVPALPSAPPISRFQAHPCTPDERAKRTAEITRRNGEAQQRQTRESAQLAQVIGMDPRDETAMRAYAAVLGREAGWKSVAYRGNGVFDVDYAVTGRLDRDFVFPVLPRASIIAPFVVIRARNDGTVLIDAPAYRANPGQAVLTAINSGRPEGAAPISLVRGSFFVTTDIAPLTNNTDDGPTRDGSRTRLSWTVTPGSDKIPETLIPLGR